MKSRLKALLPFAAMLAVFGFLLAATGISADTPIPSEFYGTVKVDGENVPDGTLVDGLIGDGNVAGSTTTFTFEGDSVYVLLVEGHDEETPGPRKGGVEGDTVRFTVDGKPADQTGTWSSGASVELNLTVTSARSAASGDLRKAKETGPGLKECELLFR